MKRKVLYVALLIFVLADTGYSFLQHYHMPLDGDMAEGILPGKDVQPVLDDPFGVRVLLDGKSYPNPNRFFSHWAFMKYFQNMPLALQQLTEPINSIYLSCAIAKTFFQLLLIYVLSLLISGTPDIRRLRFIAAAAITSPFFQSNGYRGLIGIIDESITYSFFYALPTLLLLIFFLPVFLETFYNRKFFSSKVLYALWPLLAVPVCLSGPLNPGIILVAGTLFYSHKLFLFIKDRFSGVHIPAVQKMNLYGAIFIPAMLLSAYSLYIGTFNSVTISQHIPMTEVYKRLPFGIWELLTRKLGLGVLLLFVIINALLIRRHVDDDEQSKKIWRLFKWMILFCAFYLLLLPFGGYRVNRPQIVRFDTFIPVTVSLILFFGISSLYILRAVSGKFRFAYGGMLAGVVLLFTLADEPEPDKNKCEKAALLYISRSPEKIVLLPDACTVLSWQIITAPLESQRNARLLKMWRVTKEEKLYYQKGQPID